jgi:hypothetical protein
MDVDLIVLSLAMFLLFLAFCRSAQIDGILLLSAVADKRLARPRSGGWKPAGQAADCELSRMVNSVFREAAAACGTP